MLAVTIEAAGLECPPMVVLASVLPFLVEIERIELKPGDELVLTALGVKATPGGATTFGEDIQITQFGTPSIDSEQPWRYGAYRRISRRSIGRVGYTVE